MQTDGRVNADLVAGIQAVGERGLGVDGVHVRILGQPSTERHWLADIRRDVFSVSKTFTSVAVGIAQAEGLLDVKDTVLPYLQNLTSDAAPGFEAITIQHLLTMSSGIVYRWDDPDADHGGDAAQAILSTPLGAAPGEVFAYRGANTYLLSRIIHAISGQDLRDFLLPRLFRPLGIKNPQWHRCPIGYSLGAVGLQLRTEEIARLGRTLLERGRYADLQLIPASYVAAMISDPVTTGGHRAMNATGGHPDNARYGLHVWLCDRDGAWRMDGIYGQFSIILPHHQACVTITSHYQGATTDILDAIWADIVPALSLVLDRDVQAQGTTGSNSR